MDMTDRIRNLRKELKLTQEQFGKKCGVSKAAVSLWEKGSSSPQRDALMMLQKTCNINPAWIVGESKAQHLQMGVGESHPEYNAISPETLQTALALGSLPENIRQRITDYINTHAAITQAATPAELDQALADSFDPDEIANTGNNLSEKNASLKIK